MSPRGRRPGGEDTRGAIVAAARREFAAQGYAATTLRGIARAAGVDPRLVHHYFDGKREVFVASIGVDAQPGAVVEAVAAGGPDGAGARLVGTFLAVWDQPVARERLVATLSGVVTDPVAARTVREFVLTEVFAPITDRLGVTDGERRASLVIAQMVGLAMARFVLKVEPLASMPTDQVVSAVGPTVQRYLTGPL